MKRFLFFLLSLIFCISLFACGGGGGGSSSDSDSGTIIQTIQEVEPNDGTSETDVQNIIPPIIIEGSVSYNSDTGLGDEYDVFKFTPSSTVTLSFELSGFGSYDLDIYGATWDESEIYGSIVDAPLESNSEYFTYNFEGGITYYIGVEAWDTNGETANYRLEIKKVELPDIDTVQSNFPAQGLYTGSTFDGRSYTGLILGDGTFYFLYSEPNFPDYLGGVFQGKAFAFDESLISTNAKDFNVEGLGVLSATVNGWYFDSYPNNDYVFGTVRYTSPRAISYFSGTYQSEYELAPSLGKINGNYSGEVLTSEGWEPSTLNISSTGIITGIGQSGCTVSGSVSTRTDGNVYDFTATFGATPCLFANQTFTGIAYYNESRSWLYVAAPNASRTDGVLFSGGKL